MDSFEREKATHEPDLPHAFGHNSLDPTGKASFCILCGKTRQDAIHDVKKIETASDGNFLVTEKGV